MNLKIIELIDVWLGYDASDDLAVINYMIQAETQRVLNDINHTELPIELEHVIIYRVIGAYIQSCLTKIVNDEDSQIATSIKMGDTQINLNGTSKTDKINRLLEAVSNYGWEELSCYRRIRW